MGTRLLGALVAAGISLSLAVIPSKQVELASLSIDLVGMGLLGAPLAAALAMWLTPAAAAGSWRLAGGIGIALGFAAAYLGVVELAPEIPEPIAVHELDQKQRRTRVEEQAPEHATVPRDEESVLGDLHREPRAAVAEYAPLAVERDQG